MDATFLRKTFALIAKGLVEKEQLLQKEPTRYPYSKALQHGSSGRQRIVWRVQACSTGKQRLSGRIKLAPCRI